MLEVFKPGAKLVVNSALSVLPAQARKRFKEYHELRYWRGVTRLIAHDRAKLEHERAHYEFFFTTFFGLSADDYAGAAVLDIGCGPCGSLEWASGARGRSPGESRGGPDGFGRPAPAAGRAFRRSPASAFRGLRDQGARRVP